MSKLDRFLVSDGIFSIFPTFTAVCLDRHLSDHRPIILKEIQTDFGPTPFRLYHSWFKRDGFDAMVELAWRSSSHNDSNSLIRFKKKLQDLKKIIRIWIREMNISKEGEKNSLTNKLVDIDKDLDNGIISDDMLLNRLERSRKLYEIKQSDLKDVAQKAKVKWALEGDENSNFFHGIINKRRAQLAIRGIFYSGVWHTDPTLVKQSFFNHFANRFKQPTSSRLKLNILFTNRLTPAQIVDLDRNITCDEIKAAVWDCGENKSPGPDGFTFEFFKHFWDLISSDLCAAVTCFFDNGSFPRGCNSSFIALIPKVSDAKFVTDFRLISLIGSVYKVITKILANRLSTVISDLVSNTQSAFIKKRQILDGPFILNEALAWCKRKKKQALMFKVDFTKASNMASILVNGSPTNEFLISCGLKQGDPLAPMLFILVMESLHIFVTNVVMMVSSKLASGLKINMHKSQVLGVGVPSNVVNHEASTIGCTVMNSPFKYLGVTVGDHMSHHSAWSNIIQKVRARLSKWKANTVSIGGRLALLKSILGSVPLYSMSIYKVPKGVLHELEMIRNNFFIGADSSNTKINWVAWEKVLASKKHRGHGVSSYFGLNRALLLKWVLRFLSQDGSLWFQVIGAIYGSSFEYHTHNFSSCWISILRELDNWISDLPLSLRFPRIFTLERDKTVLVAVKRGASSLNASFRRQIHVGNGLNTKFWLDNWISDLPLSLRFEMVLRAINGMFHVKDIRLALDDLFLPSSFEATRWVNFVPIKVNVFAWRARLNRLPTRVNLAKRGVIMDSSLCSICGLFLENAQHLFFRCELASSIALRLCNWWNLNWSDIRRSPNGIPGGLV
nr:putative RNA-directed DNA polymerase, eukaryota, reverse transcriptase zinc-binding domain protein [Tanacetum cinerariifolium]